MSLAVCASSPEPVDHQIHFVAGPLHRAKAAVSERLNPMMRPPDRIPALPDETPRVASFYRDAPSGKAQSELPLSRTGVANGVVLKPKIVDSDRYITGHTGDWAKGTPEAERRARGFVDVFNRLGGHRFKILGDIIYPVFPRDRSDPRLHTQLSGIVAALQGRGIDVPLVPGNHDWSNLKGEEVEPDRIRAMIEHAESDPVLVAPARYWAQEIHLNSGRGPRILEIYLDTEFLDEDPQQLKWFDDLMAKNTCDQVVVHGHRGIVSGGYHGKNDGLETHLAPRLNAYRAICSYECAHDHHNEELLHPSVRVPMAVSGTAGESRMMTPTPATLFGGNRPAFRVVSYDGETQHVRWLSERGDSLYETRYVRDAEGWIRPMRYGALAALRSAPGESASGSSKAAEVPQS